MESYRMRAYLRLLFFGVLANAAISFAGKSEVIRHEVPPPLISLLKSLGRMKLSYEFSSAGEDSEVLRKLTTRFQLNDALYLELTDPSKLDDDIARSLVPKLKIGEAGLFVALTALLRADGVFDATLDFQNGGDHSSAMLPVVFESKRLGEFIVGIRSLHWTAMGLDPTVSLSSQEINLTTECEVATLRSRDQGAWSPVGCRGSIQFDPTVKKWFYQILLEPTPLESENSLSVEGCPSSTLEVQGWMNELFHGLYESHLPHIPKLIDHPLGGEILAQGSFEHEPYREYFSNFLIRLDKEDIYLGPANFGIVLKIPKNSWIFVCGDTRPESLRPYIEISFYRVATRFFTRKQFVKSGPIRIRWRPISGAANSINEVTGKVPLVSDFFRLLRDVSAPIQDVTFSTLGSLEVDKIRLTATGIEFNSSGRLLRALPFGLDKKIDSNAFEQVLIPPASPDENP